MLVEGMFVTVASGRDSLLGTGRLTSLREGIAVVEYFDGPGLPVPPAVTCPASNLRPVVLEPQTRAYRRLPGGRWQAGRVVFADAVSAQIRFPNRQMLDLESEEFRVRWSRPLGDPTALLAAETTETPFLADARSQFLHALSRQRAAASGVTAVQGASVELVGYQFEVIRRVVTDPVQRYLLADEVGLGKTVEAAVILRQYFLDDPAAANALVLVPATLVSQWREELTRRFGLGGVLDHDLHVRAHDDASVTASIIASAGMLIVDEAHHLSGDDGRGEALYDLLARHAPRTGRLLLLSATPALGDERGFLRIMHLLDPVLFPLDDVEGLRSRIASRQLIAEVAASLVPENLWGLEPDLARLMGAHGDDPALSACVSALRRELARLPEEDDEAFLAALDALRTHLTEGYRLHRRMLRNRRASVPWATPQRRGATVRGFSGGATPDFVAAMESLRLLVDPASPEGRTVAASLMSLAMHPGGGLSAAAACLDAGLADPTVLRAAEEVDRRAALVRADGARIAATCEVVRDLVSDPARQVVVFCDRSRDADQCAAALGRALDITVVRHGDAAWQRFQDEPAQVRILVCDARAEEGVNLHGGRKSAVHFDMPCSPNRVEQRIGRLDRFGSGERISGVVITDEANEHEAALCSLVGEAWGVHDRSIASLQYLIEDSMRTLAVDWLGGGCDAVNSLTAALAGPEGLVASELRRIDAQDALDALGAPNEDAVGALTVEDDRWKEWRDAFRGMAFSVLGFEERIQPVPASTVDPVFRVRYVPRDQHNPTLLTLPAFLRHFVGMLDLQAPGGGAAAPMTSRYAFMRKTAVRPAALDAGVRLLRIGDPVVTSIEEFCRTDDRGRAFAVWRADRTYVPADASGADLFMRFEFVVSASTDGGAGFDGDAAGQRTLARLAGTFLQPLAVTIWLDWQGREVTDPPAVLTAPYCANWEGTRRDFNLSPERWAALPRAVRSTWLEGWADFCAARRKDALVCLRASAAYQEHVAAALRACDRDIAIREAQVAVRIGRLCGAARESEAAYADRERGALTAVRRAIMSPDVAAEVVGAMFVSPEVPF